MNVIISNPDTKGQCGDLHLGEVRLYFFFHFTLKVGLLKFKYYSEKARKHLPKLFCTD